MRCLVPMLAFSGVMGLAGCASVPPMDLADGGTTVPASVRIINQIACEIHDAPQFSQLRAQGYAISAVVTMKVEDKGALTPAVSFIDLFGRSGNSYTSALGGELSRTRTRTFTQTFTIHAGQVGCDGDVSRRFRGSLGLDEVIATGLYPLPGGITFVQAQTAESARAAQELPLRAFGSTIEFKLTRGLNGGPQWIRPLFKGPGAGSGLFGLSRTDTDTLVITFGPPKPNTKGADAAKTAQDQSRELLNTMVLQNLDLAH